MTKAQAIQSFWASFGLTAYEENSVPSNATFPYITYELNTDSFGNTVSLNASLWYKTSTWVAINNKAETIARTISGGTYVTCDEGAVLIDKGTPFAQRMGDSSDDTIKRVLLNVTAEFLTRT